MAGMKKNDEGTTRPQPGRTPWTLPKQRRSNAPMGFGFSSGEFARLCGTTKQTLFHYDQLGLLKPAVIEDNGYRAYSPQQFFVFDMINLMKQGGSSLKEIKSYLANYEPGAFLAILKDKQEELERESRKIEQLLNRMRRTMADTEYAVNALDRPPEVMELAEDHLLVCPATDNEQFAVDGWTDDARGALRDLVRRVSDHFAYCERHPEISRTPLGVIITHEDLRKGTNQVSWFFSRAGKQIDSPRMMIRPAGKYAARVFRGGAARRGQVLDELTGWIRQQGQQPAGDAYVYELVGHWATSSMDQAISQVLIGLA